MSTFAHIETGQVLDPQENDTAEQYLARYHSPITAGWNVVQVPDGTLHNAKVNGDGMYTNPPLPSRGATTITVTEFKKRFTFAEKSGIASSTDAGVKVFWDELNTVGTVDLTDGDTIAGMAYLVGLSLLTQSRSTAILTP